MIILIDNYDSFTYNLYQQFSGFYRNVQVYRNNKISVEEVDKLNPKAIIISPGPCTPTEAGICIDLIRTLAYKYPIFGVCLGVQSIAVAFGGNVIRANEVVHGKSGIVYHKGGGLFMGVPNPFEAGRYHSLVVDRATIPEELEIQAETSQGLIMGVKHKLYPCYGIQFHPESILTEWGSVIVKNFIDMEVETTNNKGKCL